MIKAEWTNKDSLDLQPTCNQLATTEGDLISRQALCQYASNQKDKSVTPNDIMRFPSADSNTNQHVQHVGSVDLISRQAAIRWVKIECNPYGNPTIDFESGKKVIEHLKQMPPAQPERKRGEWVGVHAYCVHLNEEAKANGKTERYMPSGMVIGVYCNQCWYIAERKSNFCPSCGADMREEKDGG